MPKTGRRFQEIANRHKVYFRCLSRYANVNVCVERSRDCTATRFVDCCPVTSPALERQVSPRLCLDQPVLITE